MKWGTLEERVEIVFSSLMALDNVSFYKIYGDPCLDVSYIFPYFAELDINRLLIRILPCSKYFTRLLS